MPFRLSVLLLVLACAGCTTQRDAADLEPTADTTATDTSTTRGGMSGPNIAVYLDGTWDLVLTPRDGGEAMTATWTVNEGGPNRLTLSGGTDAEVVVTERSVTGDVFFVRGRAEAEPGLTSFEMGGTLQGNQINGEAVIEGLGTFDLAGDRQLD